MSDIPNIGSIDNLSLDSGIVIIQDDCFKYVTVAEFLKLFAESGGGSGSGSGSICDLFQACNEGIGEWDSYDPEEPNLPTMEDIYVSLSNRQETYVFTSQQFLDSYYDEDGDTWERIVLTSGDFTGVTFNGEPVYVGLVIYANEISQFKYDTRNVDFSYNQNIGFKLYNDKNEESV